MMTTAGNGHGPAKIPKGSSTTLGSMSSKERLEVRSISHSQFFVIPAKAGIQSSANISGFRIAPARTWD
jgi:hypothetical protein